MQRIVSINKVSLKRSKQFALTIKKLSVKRGEVLCIVGANGSGKTTLIEMLCGFILPNSGNVKLLGQNLKLNDFNLKRRIGYVPDDDQWIIPELTALEYFKLISKAYAKNPIEIETFEHNAQQLANKLHFNQLNQLLGSLSHGNKKKVQIVAALMHEPDLLIVDELRNGLDPIAILHAETLITEQTLNGMSVVAATHDLWWAERIADEIVMLKQGEVVFSNSTQIIVELFGSIEAKFMDVYSHAV